MLRVVSLLLAGLLAGCALPEARHELVTQVGPLTRQSVPAAAGEQFAPSRFVSSHGRPVPYRLLAPAKLQSDKSYPLVVVLHGSDAIGTDNLSQLGLLAKGWAAPEVRERYPAYVLVPQFPIRTANYGPPDAGQHAQPSEAVADALELVRDFSAKHPVDRSRIYVIGFSMGGSTAQLLPTLGPSTFAAVVSVSGIAPDNAQAAPFKALPVLFIHGNADTENPIGADRRFFAALQAQGGSELWFREYDGLAHSPPSDMQPGLWWRDWLFRQQRR